MGLEQRVEALETWKSQMEVVIRGTHDTVCLILKEQRQLEHKVIVLEERFDRLEERMDRLEERMDRLENKFDDRIDKLENKFDDRIDKLETSDCLCTGGKSGRGREKGFELTSSRKLRSFRHGAFFKHCFRQVLP